MVRSTPPQGRYIDLDLGVHHSCALDAVGDIHCWGEEYAHSATYTEGPYTQFKTAYGVTCALGPDRLLECWESATFHHIGPSLKPNSRQLMLAT